MEASRAGWFAQPEDVPGASPATEVIEAEAHRGLAALRKALECGWGPFITAFVEHAGPLCRWLFLHTQRVLAEWNNLLLLPLLVLIVLEVGMENPPGSTAVELRWMSVVFSASFLAEWLLGLLLARQRSAYLCNFWLWADVLSALPLGMALQALRLTRIARIVRLVRISRLLRSRGRRIPVRRLLRAAAVSFNVAICGAFIIQAAEPGRFGALSEALWWASVTITTVGYGDIVPTSPVGRTIGVALMVAGIGVFSYLAGIMAASVFDPEEDETLETVRRMESELAELKALIVSRGRDA